MTMNIQQTCNAIKTFRNYVEHNFTSYMRKGDMSSVNTSALLQILNDYKGATCTEIQNAQKDLYKRIVRLQRPSTFQVIDEMSEVIPRLDEITDAKERDAQFLDYYDWTQEIYERVARTDINDLDVLSLCKELEQLGNQYNDITKEYNQILIQVIHECGNDKGKILDLIDTSSQVVYDDVARRNGLDDKRDIHPVRQRSNDYNSEDFKHYSEEISNMGMYVLNEEVGHDELPQIIQKVQERGDAYNTYTQRVSRQITQELENVLHNEDYSDGDVQVAAMGILMGSADSISHHDHDDD